MSLTIKKKPTTNSLSFFSCVLDYFHIHSHLPAPINAMQCRYVLMDFGVTGAGA